MTLWNYLSSNRASSSSKRHFQVRKMAWIIKKNKLLSRQGAWNPTETGLLWIPIIITLFAIRPLAKCGETSTRDHELGSHEAVYIFTEGYTSIWTLKRIKVKILSWLLLSMSSFKPSHQAFHLMYTTMDVEMWQLWIHFRGWNVVQKLIRCVPFSGYL